MYYCKIYNIIPLEEICKTKRLTVVLSIIDANYGGICMESIGFLGGSPKEIEILEFKVGGNSYGMDVTLVKEIITYLKPTPVPNTHPCIEGLIMPRDELITVVNLTKCLEQNDVEEFKKEMLIITNHNNDDIAFHVDSVKGIFNATSTDIIIPDEGKKQYTNDYVIGILMQTDKQLEVLNIEGILKGLIQYKK